MSVNRAPKVIRDVLWEGVVPLCSYIPLIEWMDVGYNFQEVPLSLVAFLVTLETLTRGLPIERHFPVY